MSIMLGSLCCPRRGRGSHGHSKDTQGLEVLTKRPASRTYYETLSWSDCTLRTGLRFPDVAFVSLKQQSMVRMDGSPEKRHQMLEIGQEFTGLEEILQ
jgi:hypothetical protein